MKKQEFLRKRVERLLDTVMNITINEPTY